MEIYTGVVIFHFPYLNRFLRIWLSGPRSCWCKWQKMVVIPVCEWSESLLWACHLVMVRIWCLLSPILSSTITRLHVQVADPPTICTPNLCLPMWKFKLVKALLMFVRYRCLPKIVLGIEGNFSSWGSNKRSDEDDKKYLIIFSRLNWKVNVPEFGRINERTIY